MGGWVVQHFHLLQRPQDIIGLLWGYVGILSFGQAAFFALGAYAMGLAMHTDLGINPAYIGLLLSLVVGGILAAVTGYFLFSAGVSSPLTSIWMRYLRLSRSMSAGTGPSTSQAREAVSRAAATLPAPVTAFSLEGEDTVKSVSLPPGG